MNLTLSQESGDSDLSEKAKVIVEYDPESAMEPLAHDNWIANTAAKYRRPNRGTRCCKIDFIISKVWTLGKQLIRILRTAIV